MMCASVMTNDISIDLCDREKNTAMSQTGFIIEPFLSPHHIEVLRRIHGETCAHIDSDYHVTAFIDDPRVRMGIRDRIAAVVAQPLADLAPGYQIFNASFVTKKARSTSGRLGLHQDYTLVDATAHRGMNVWVPLCDVDGTNGCLKLVAGSHKFAHISANPPNPSPYDSVRDVLDRDYMVERPMRAGHACLFDTGVLHETEENVSTTDRVAVFLNLIPAGTAPKLYQWRPSNPETLEFYEISLDVVSHLKPNAYMHDAVEHGARLLGMIDYRFKRLTSGDLERLLPRPVSLAQAPVNRASASATLLGRLTAMWNPSPPRR